jgi:tRNA dimethylallyltransferase
MAKPKTPLAIVGPTGVGKTAYALQLAPKISAEIISADSRQVFIGMDIATGKESDRGRWATINNRRTLIINDTPIHALDLVTPDQEFSVSQWHAVAVQLIDEIIQRGHRPLIVGGTGFYLDALMGRVQTMDILPNPDLRAELQNLNRAQLQEKLKSIAPHRWQQMNYSDQQNPARLMRAIEIETARRQDGKTAPRPVDRREEKGESDAIPHQSPISNLQSPTAKITSPAVHHDDIQKSELESQNSELFMVGLTMPRHQLYAKIDSRFDQMLQQGLLEETRRLISQYGRHHQSMTSLGYAEIADHLDGKISLAAAMQKFKNRAHSYARRQYTWFNHRPVHWIDITQPGWQNQANRLVQATLQSKNSSL